MQGLDEKCSCRDRIVFAEGKDFLFESVVVGQKTGCYLVGAAESVGSETVGSATFAPRGCLRLLLERRIGCRSVGIDDGVQDSLAALSASETACLRLCRSRDVFHGKLDRNLACSDDIQRFAGEHDIGKLGWAFDVGVRLHGPFEFGMHFENIVVGVGWPDAAHLSEARVRFDETDVDYFQKSPRVPNALVVID